jgi:hypothetical protein
LLSFDPIKNSTKKPLYPLAGYSHEDHIKLAKLFIPIPTLIGYPRVNIRCGKPMKTNGFGK